MSVVTLEDTLHAGLKELALALSEAQERALTDYVRLLHKWNRVYNLTAVRDPRAMVFHHVLDSLSVLPHLGGVRRLVDVGAGAGLPGIPLAIARPELHVVLTDSSHKKAAFMQQACLELGLARTTVICERVERIALPEKADAAISRAFADLREFLRLARHLVAPGGRLLAMKGVYPDEELAQLPPGVRWQAVPLAVPGLTGKRHLVVMEVE